MILTTSKVKSINIDRVINQNIQFGTVHELVIIVPTNRKLRNLKKEIIGKSPGGSVRQINVETLTTISTKLLSVQHSFSELSEAASSLFIKRCAEQTDFRYFSLYEKSIPRGTLDKLRNVISEYKRQGITPGKLRNEAQKLEGSEKLKAEDIADLYESYRKKCYELNAYEIGDIYMELLLLDDEQIETSIGKSFESIKNILVIGYDEFTSQEIEILKRISQLNEIDLFVQFEYSEQNPQVFAQLDKCYQSFRQNGFMPIIDETEIEKNDFLNLCSEKLFNVSDESFQKISCSDKITKLHVRNRPSEVETIAKEIKKLILKEGIEPHKICVAFNNINNYSSSIRDIFDSYKIPYNLTDRFSLDNSIPVITLIGFLEILLNDFSISDINRACSTHFLEIKDLDLNNLNRISVELKVISGFENWKEKLESEIKRKEEEDKTSSKLAERALNNLNEISELLKPFRFKQSISSFYENLKKLCSKLKMPEIILNSSGENTEKNIKAFTYFFEVLNEVFKLQVREFGTNEEFYLSHFLDQIKTIAGWARYNVKERADYGVQITSINEIRGLDYDYLFIGGMCDGDLPTRYNPEIFFSGSFVKKEREHQAEERFEFYQALKVWKKHLYLSVPKFQDDERELTESNFIKEFEKVIEIEQKTEDDFETLIYSEFDLMIKVGESINDEKLTARLLDDKLQNELKEKIRIDKERENNLFDESEYNGFLKEGSIVEMEKRKYSASQLETYGKCPFKFFIERILKINLPEVPTEEIESLEMGEVLHNILQQFYEETYKKDIKISNCSELQFNKCLKRLLEIAEKNIEESSFESLLSFFDKEKILGIGGNVENSILYKFLKLEQESDDGFIPQKFEVGFGKSDSEHEIKINDKEIRGRIDRIDINDEKKLFNIVDYKLGAKNVTLKNIEAGIDLQLPLYLMAADKILESEGYKPNLMQIYSLKLSDKFGKNQVSFGNKKNINYQEKNEELMTEVENIVKDFIENIENGIYNLSKHEKREEIVCKYCELKPVCRISELK